MTFINVNPVFEKFFSNGDRTARQAAVASTKKAALARANAAHYLINVASSEERVD